MKGTRTSKNLEVATAEEELEVMQDFHANLANTLRYLSSNLKYLADEIDAALDESG